MKTNLLVLCISFLMVSCSTNTILVPIPAGQRVEIDYPDYQLYSASIQNKSKNTLEVKVLNRDTRNQVRGFGLGKKSNADVVVELENRLMVQNTGSKDTKLSITITAQDPELSIENSSDTRTYVSFTLQNTSVNSIPLIIPSVMNPNLSPFSKSGVDLRIGQEIYFKDGMKKYILLVVDQSIEDGAVIDVAALLKERRKELGLDK